MMVIKSAIDIEHWEKSMDRDELIAQIGNVALTATLYEVSAAPKPGLVDPFSRGAHSDMDYFTFLASAVALAPFFAAFASMGAEIEGESPALLPELRKLGIEAERAMFAATNGVNTHKGLIFSMGLVCAAAGRLLISKKQAESNDKNAMISGCAQEAADIVAGITVRELVPLVKADKSLVSDPIKATNAMVCSLDLSAGEKSFVKYGIRGVRGEAEDGFPSVINHALPRLHSDLLRGMSWNDAMIDALLVLYLKVDDTTVLNRGGSDGLAYIRAQAAAALSRGGMRLIEGRDFVQSLDADFSQRGLSPGGCADLLAVTVFLEMLSNKWTKQQKANGSAQCSS